MRDIGNKFLNSVEISTQEIVYIVLHLPMRKSSREVIFINISPPEESVQPLKPMNVIVEMEDDSEIHSTGLIKRYMERATSMENVTLADWAALYDSPRNSLRKKSKSLDTDNLHLETGKDDDNGDKFADFIEEGKHNAKIKKPK